MWPNRYQTSYSYDALQSLVSEEWIIRRPMVAPRKMLPPNTHAVEVTTMTGR